MGSRREKVCDHMRKHRWFKLYFYTLGFTTLNVLKSIAYGILAILTLFVLLIMWVFWFLFVLIMRHNILHKEKKFAKTLNNMQSNVQSNADILKVSNLKTHCEDNHI